jgi:AcrR family transcriptional regulator
VARTYVSKLRAEQADATRLRIIEAVAAVLARDLSEFTIPSVAAEAGVSVATVQRIFPTKRDLLESLARQYAATIGSAAFRDPPPADIEEFLARIPEVNGRSAALPPGLRAAVASDAFNEFRREHRAEQRLRPIEKVLKPYEGSFTNAELRMIRDLIAVLGSSAGLAAFTELTGSSHEEASATMTWTIRRILGLEETRDPKPGL